MSEGRWEMGDGVSASVVVMWIGKKGQHLVKDLASVWQAEGSAEGLEVGWGLLMFVECEV